MGWPLWLIDQTMPEMELSLWRAYEAKRGFPSRRRELGLALVSLTIARCAGKIDNVTLKDFLFDPPEEIETHDDPVAAARAAFKFNPRRKRTA